MTNKKPTPKKTTKKAAAKKPATKKPKAVKATDSSVHVHTESAVAPEWSKPSATVSNVVYAADVKNPKTKKKFFAWFRR